MTHATQDSDAISVERDILAATFQSRIRLVRLARGQASTDADAEWVSNREWFLARTKTPGSFLWFCAEFDLERSAVLKALDLTDTKENT